MISKHQVSIDDESAYGLVLQREITLFRDSRDGEDIEIGIILHLSVLILLVSGCVIYKICDEYLSCESG